MGFLTNVSISNDFWHEIAKDPDRLIEAISIGMNDGVEGPLAQTWAAKDQRAGCKYSRSTHNWHVSQRIPQGVTVHKAQHYDTPQIIVNTYGSHAIAAHEIVPAIQDGWLDLNKYNEEHAEAVAKLLHAEARRIRKAIKNKKAGKSVYAD